VVSLVVVVVVVVVVVFDAVASRGTARLRARSHPAATVRSTRSPALRVCRDGERPLGGALRTD